MFIFVADAEECRIHWSTRHADANRLFAHERKMHFCEINFLFSQLCYSRLANINFLFFISIYFQDPTTVRRCCSCLCGSKRQIKIEKKRIEWNKLTNCSVIDLSLSQLKRMHLVIERSFLFVFTETINFYFHSRNKTIETTPKQFHLIRGH